VKGKLGLAFPEMMVLQREECAAETDSLTSMRLPP